MNNRFEDEDLPMFGMAWLGGAWPGKAGPG